MSKKSNTARKIITPDTLESYRRMLIEDEKSPATIKQYSYGLERFTAFAGDQEITKSLAVRFKQELNDAGCYAPRTINTILAAVNSFFKHMGWYDCIVKTVKIQQETFRPSDRELTKAEYEKLLRTARKLGKERICLVMQTICATGIRVSELKFITVEAVRKGYAEVNMKGKNRRVLLPKDLRKLLNEYIHKTGRKSGSVFVTRNGKPLDRSNICREMKALCQEAGIERSKVFPHNLRHLFACVYCEQDKNINNLADLLGHSDVNTTRIYTQISMGKLFKLLNRMKLAAISPWESENEKAENLRFKGLSASLL